MWQITTHDGKTYTITQKDPNRIKELAKRLGLVPVTLANGKIEYFSKGTVARMSQVSQPAQERLAIAAEAQGDRARVDNEGFQKFQQKKAELFGSRRRTR
jgi:hypothetical protein|nr:MAG TPA: hypothetical protein [Caudoviricetes sp.]DAP75760.1 MAG TPA: hypothetical protein [Caudoviricetes sp.]